MQPRFDGRTCLPERLPRVEIPEVVGLHQRLVRNHARRPLAREGLTNLLLGHVGEAGRCRQSVTPRGRDSLGPAGVARRQQRRVAGRDVRHRHRRVGERGGDERVDRLRAGPQAGGDLRRAARKFAIGERGIANPRQEHRVGDPLRMPEEHLEPTDDPGQDVVLFGELDKLLFGIRCEIALRQQVVGKPLPQASVGLAALLRHQGVVVALAIRQALCEILLDGRRAGPPGEGHEPIDAVLENAVQRVVVTGRDRVVLVVVTAGAGHGETEHAPGDHVDTVVDDVGSVAEKPPAEREKSHRCEVFRLVGGGLVGGQLQPQETIVRHVLIECPDHPVAVGGRVNVPACLTDVGVALRVGIAGGVEPVPPPVLPITRRREEPVDERFVRLRRGIALEGLDLVDRRGQAEEVVGGAADERGPIGFGRRPKSRGLQGGEHEPVYRATDPRFVRDRRQRRRDDRLVGPVRLTGGCSWRRNGGIARGPDRPRGDPCLHGVEDVRRYRRALLGRRHAHRVVVTCEPRCQLPDRRVSRHHRRPAVTPVEHTLQGIESQRPPLLRIAVAFLAAVDEQRSHMPLEQVHGFAGHRRVADDE